METDEETPKPATAANSVLVRMRWWGAQQVGR